MSISAATREQVRLRAGLACEYCGVTEVGAGGTLTVDHFRPQSQGGDNALDNLVYCCHPCNEYKSDYWPDSPDRLPLWNPRQSPAAEHLLELADGALFPISPSGALTIDRLRLNRPALIRNRLSRRHQMQTEHLLKTLDSLLPLIAQLTGQQGELLAQNRLLLEEQRQLLLLLISRQPES